MSESRENLRPICLNTFLNEVHLRKCNKVPRSALALKTNNEKDEVPETVSIRKDESHLDESVDFVSDSESDESQYRVNMLRQLLTPRTKCVLPNKIQTDFGYVHNSTPDDRAIGNTSTYKAREAQQTSNFGSFTSLSPVSNDQVEDQSENCPNSNSDKSDSTSSTNSNELTNRSAFNKKEVSAEEHSVVEISSDLTENSTINNTEGISIKNESTTEESALVNDNSDLSEDAGQLFESEEPETMDKTPKKANGSESDEETNAVMMELYGDQWESLKKSVMKTRHKESTLKKAVTVRRASSCIKKENIISIIPNECPDTDTKINPNTDNKKSHSHGLKIRQRLIYDESTTTGTDEDESLPLRSKPLKSSDDESTINNSGNATESSTCSSNNNASDKSLNCSENSVRSVKISVTDRKSRIPVLQESTLNRQNDENIQNNSLDRLLVPDSPHKYSFLRSLSESTALDYRCHPSARMYRINFQKFKIKLSSDLFRIFNKKVFDGLIPSEVPLVWNSRMRNTAGNCVCRKSRSIGSTTNGGMKIKCTVEKISLSTKVCDTAERLRDTIVHEMCHAVTWLVNEVNTGHGPEWRKWAERAQLAFPELPVITRCHSYDIHTKYTYKCTCCGYSFGRHQKSLDLTRKRCGCCGGHFEILLNKTTKTGETKTISATPKRAPTGFALFVKENYAFFRSPSLAHGDVMKLLGKKFSELKVAEDDATVTEIENFCRQKSNK